METSATPAPVTLAQPRRSSAIPGGEADALRALLPGVLLPVQKAYALARLFLDWADQNESGAVEAEAAAMVASLRAGDHFLYVRLCRGEHGSVVVSRTTEADHANPGPGVLAI